MYTKKLFFYFYLQENGCNIMVKYINNIYLSVAFFLRKENMFRRKGVLIMQKKNLSRIALSGLLALSMVPAASM